MKIQGGSLCMFIVPGIRHSRSYCKNWEEFDYPGKAHYHILYYIVLYCLHTTQHSLSLSLSYYKNWKEFDDSEHYTVKCRSIALHYLYIAIHYLKMLCSTSKSLHTTSKFLYTTSLSLYTTSTHCNDFNRL